MGTEAGRQLPHGPHRGPLDRRRGAPGRRAPAPAPRRRPCRRAGSRRCAPGTRPANRALRRPRQGQLAHAADGSSSLARRLRSGSSPRTPPGTGRRTGHRVEVGISSRAWSPGGRVQQLGDLGQAARAAQAFPEGVQGVSRQSCRRHGRRTGRELLDQARAWRVRPGSPGRPGPPEASALDRWMWHGSQPKCAERPGQGPSASTGRPGSSIQRAIRQGLGRFFALDTSSERRAQGSDPAGRAALRPGLRPACA